MIRRKIRKKNQSIQRARTGRKKIRTLSTTKFTGRKLKGKGNNSRIDQINRKRNLERVTWKKKEGLKEVIRYGTTAQRLNAKRVLRHMLRNKRRLR